MMLLLSAIDADNNENDNNIFPSVYTVCVYVQMLNIKIFFYFFFFPFFPSLLSDCCQWIVCSIQTKIIVKKKKKRNQTDIGIMCVIQKGIMKS